MLTNHQLEIAKDALMVASQKLVDDSEKLEMISDQLRAGEKVFPFMDGEPGAQAADQMAASKRERAQHFDDLYQAIDDILYP